MRGGRHKGEAMKLDRYPEMDAYGDNDAPSTGGAIGIAIGVGASVAAAILIGFALWAIWKLT
jgi:hypothetical protein